MILQVKENLIRSDVGEDLAEVYMVVWVNIGYNTPYLLPVRSMYVVAPRTYLLVWSME
jgi:hypothetical protein